MKYVVLFEDNDEFAHMRPKFMADHLQFLSDNADKVDAITGATYTSRGVENLVRFWLGPQGYGPYLKHLREGKGQANG